MPKLLRSNLSIITLVPISSVQHFQKGGLQTVFPTKFLKQLTINQIMERVNFPTAALKIPRSFPSGSRVRLKPLGLFIEIKSTCLPKSNLFQKASTRAFGYCF